MASKLVGPSGLVDDLKPRQLAFDEGMRQQVKACRVDRGLEHGVARAVEADELTSHAAMHDFRFDARPRRVDRPQVTSRQEQQSRKHHAADDCGRNRGVLRVRDGGRGEQAHVVGEVRPPRPSPASSGRSLSPETASVRSRRHPTRHPSVRR